MNRCSPCLSFSKKHTDSKNVIKCGCFYPKLKTVENSPVLWERGIRLYENGKDHIVMSVRVSVHGNSRS